MPSIQACLYDFQDVAFENSDILLEHLVGYAVWAWGLMWPQFGYCGFDLTFGDAGIKVDWHRVGGGICDGWYVVGLGVRGFWKECSLEHSCF